MIFSIWRHLTHLSKNNNSPVMMADAVGHSDLITLITWAARAKG